MSNFIFTRRKGRVVFNKSALHDVQSNDSKIYAKQGNGSYETPANPRNNPLHATMFYSSSSSNE